MRSLQLLLLMIFAIALPATADLVGLSTSAYSTVGTPVCQDGVGITSCKLSGAVPGSADPFVGVFGDVTSTATFGALQVDINAHSDDGIYGTWSAGGSASFHDTLDVAGYAGSGFIQYHATVTGFIPSAGAYGCFGVNASCSGFFQPDLFPFVAGTPFSLSVILKGIEDGSAGAQLVPGGLHLSVDQISLFDADSHPITGYTLTSASGTTYPAVGAADVPETSSSLLLLTVLFGWVALARKRQFVVS